MRLQHQAGPLTVTVSESSRVQGAPPTRHVETMESHAATASAYTNFVSLHLFVVSVKDEESFLHHFLHFRFV